MKKRSRRLVKKLHRRWLDGVMIDASQVSYWRSRLFDSKPGEVFEISRCDTSGLPRVVATAIRKLGLHFGLQCSAGRCGGLAKCKRHGGIQILGHRLPQRPSLQWQQSGGTLERMLRISFGRG